MDVKYLSYILTIVKYKNMTKAAEFLHVSQSSLSQYLSKLEQEIGTALFIRAKGELILTPAGKDYTEAATQIIKIKETLYKNIQGQHNKSHISIGVTSQFGLQITARLIPDYIKKFPDVTLAISETSVPLLTQMLLDENTDCGLMALNAITPFEPDQVHLVRKEEVYFAIPSGHPYRSINPYSVISQKELVSCFKDDFFIVGKAGSTLRYLADKIFTSYNFRPRIICETNNIPTVRSMIGDKVGVSFIAKSCLVSNPKVAYYSIKPKLYRYNALISRKNWILTAPEQALICAIQEYFEDANWDKLPPI